MTKFHVLKSYADPYDNSREEIIEANHIQCTEAGDLIFFPDEQNDFTFNVIFAKGSWIAIRRMTKDEEYQDPPVR